MGIVTAQNIRLDDAQATTDWVQIVKALAAETDFFYNGSACIANIKAAAGIYGMYLSDNVTSDISGAGTYTTVMFKVYTYAPGALEPLVNNGMQLRVGSGPSDFYDYTIFGSDTYPSKGGWQIVPVDPNISGYRNSTTGAPNLTTADYYALQADFTVTTKIGALGCAAVDIGSGLTVTGTNSVFQDFVDADEGTITNRWGYVTTNAGIIFAFGTLTIGSATVTTFTDSNFIVVWPDGLFNAGFAGLSIDLQNASTVVTMTNGFAVGKGDKSGVVDTRPDHTVTGNSGALFLNSITFDKFRNMSLTSGSTVSDSNFIAGELVTQTGGTITNGSFSQGTGTHYVLSDNPSIITNSSFTQGASGHAVRCDTPGTYDWVGNTDTGYTGTRGSNLTPSSGSTNAMFYNNSGGLITLNASGGAQSPSVRNGAGATTVVNNDVTFTFTINNSVINYEFRLYEDDPTAGVIGTVELAGEETRSTSSFVYTYSYTSDTEVVLQIIKDGYVESLTNYTLTNTPQSVNVTLTPEENI